MRRILLLMLGAAFVLGAASLGLEVRSSASHSAQAAMIGETLRPLVLFGEVFERVRASYVEKPNDEKLVQGAINGMLTSLDPHSSFMDAKSLREMKTSMRGMYGGLGLEATMEDGLIKVVS